MASAALSSKFPRFNPETITAALFALLKTSSFNFLTYTRNPTLPQNVDAALQPYLGLFLLGGSQVENQAQGLEKWLLHFRVVVYIRGVAVPEAVPTVQLNEAWQAIVNVMRSVPIGSQQTLGGIVDNAWVSGDTMFDGGNIDQQCALMIPITVDTGN